jgi:hypothetical protein
VAIDFLRILAPQLRGVLRKSTSWLTDADNQALVALEWAFALAGRVQ